VAVALLWPLALPAGPLWLAAYWTVLLWGYGSASERAALVAVWLVAGLTPVLLAEQRPRVALELSPPARAMAGLAEHRLYGDLFTDLAALPSLFPDSPAALQLLADTHRRLGDWAGARRLYQEVHDAEPDNPDALIGLGGYYFYQGDYGSAVDYFRRAAAADAENAAAYFDLSQAQSQQYHFGESSAALAQARALAPEAVGTWIASAGTERVQVPEGGLARVPELRRRLLAVEQGRGSAARRMAEARRWAALLAAAGVALAALALHLVRRPFGYGDRGPGPGRGAERWLRALIPGYGAAADGRGLLALAALTPLAALLLLPLAPAIGQPLPVVFSPGPAPLAVVAAAALAVIWLVRVWRELRGA
jgi:tetratricopeptide (TPR) repeat protein